MNTKISVFIAAIAFLLLSATTAEAQNVYFKKNGATVFQSTISDIDSIIFRTPELYAIDVSKDTDADLLLLHNDGSYAIFDYANEFGQKMLYLNSSINNTVDSTILVVLYDNGLPHIIVYEDITVVCANFNGNKFDALIYNRSEEQEPYYYWGLESNIDFSELINSSFPPSLKSDQIKHAIF